MDRVLGLLRSGDWLSRERVRMVAVALLFASCAGFFYLVVTAHGAVDLQGRPLGTDFSNIYAAGTYVRDGRPEAAFDPVQQFAREQAIFGALTQFYGWHYPPYFLFIAAALVPLGVPAMLVMFVLILHRAGFSLAMAFGKESSTMAPGESGTLRSHDSSGHNSSGHDIAALKS